VVAFTHEQLTIGRIGFNRANHLPTCVLIACRFGTAEDEKLGRPQGEIYLRGSGRMINPRKYRQALCGDFCLEPIQRLFRPKAAGGARSLSSQEC
jgi:hypothetical protein